MKYLSLQRIQQEELPFALRDFYFNRIIKHYKNIIKVPFKMKQAVDEAIAVSLEKDNKRILTAFLEDILPKNAKFETVENKLLSFRFCELYLYFNEGVC